MGFSNGLKKIYKWFTKRSIIIKTTILLVSVTIVWLFIPPNQPLFNESYSTVLLDSEGELLGAHIAADEQWRFPETQHVPYKFETAILSFEDEYFYNHPGFNPISLFKALKENILSSSFKRGGSTITMQVVRLMRKNQPRTILEKCIEIALALKLELHFSKKEILSFYVSHAPFGGNVVGLNAAAWRYFNRSPEELSWAEYSALAVLPNNPGIIYPGRSSKQFRSKRNFLLQKLLKNQKIDSLTYKLALSERLPSKPKTLPKNASHLLARSISEGFSGKTVHSTINGKFQKRITDKLEKYSSKISANKIYNAAALVIEIESGEAKAYVGNSHNGKEHHEEVDIITSNRSTGSLLKPFLYAASIDEGLLLPEQLLPDYPIYYNGFIPKNFDKKFRGAVPANIALSSSLNVPFVNLLKDYGYEKFHDMLVSTGLQSLNKPANHYGLSLILGGAESSLWELTALYAGMARKLKTANKPTGNNPNTFYSNSFLKEIKKKEAFLTNENMWSDHAIWNMFQAMAALKRPDEFTGVDYFTSSQRVAWKTGTSFGHKDAWAIGLGEKYVVGVWLGNADGEGRPGLTGSSVAAPLMFSIFEELKDAFNYEEPLKYIKPIQVCKISGYKASEFCNETKVVYLSDCHSGGGLCAFHKQVFLDESENYQVNSLCYELEKSITKNWFVLPPAQAWYYRKFNTNYKSLPETLPSCKNPELSQTMQVIYPKKLSKVYVPKEINGEKGKVIFEIAHQDLDSKVFWHLDGEYISTTIRNHQLDVSPKPGKHHFILLDETGGELSIPFEVISD